MAAKKSARKPAGPEFIGPPAKEPAKFKKDDKRRPAKKRGK